MLRWSFFGIPAIAAALAIAVPTASPADALRRDASPRGDLFAEIFRRAEVKRATLHSVRARFTETTTSSLLVRPLVAHGTIVAAAPSRVLMTYTDPEPRTVAIDQRALVVVWPGRGEREQIDVTETQKRIDHYFTHASIDDLRSSFEITAAPDPAFPQTDRIDMRPKRKQIKQGLERLELWIDRESVLLVRMRMSFPGGDRKTIHLEDIAINVPVADDTFRVRPQ